MVDNTPDDPMIKACVDVVGRAQARSLQIGHGVDGWFAQVMYRGQRIVVEGFPRPRDAALAMARRMLQGATCRCGSPVTLVDTVGACRWRLDADRWVPGCDAMSMVAPADAHGDWVALSAALPKPAPPRRHGVGRVFDGDVGGDASWLD